jgi:hypothetical protein
VTDREGISELSSFARLDRRQPGPKARIGWPRRGARSRMHLGGGMRKNLNLSTDGESISLYMNYWPWYGKTNLLLKLRTSGRRCAIHAVGMAGAMP